MKILIIQSGPLDQFKKVLNIISSENETAEVSVLTHISRTSEMLDIAGIRVYNYDAKRISPFVMGADLLSALRKVKFDRVILLYTNEYGQGYFQVRLFAQMLGGQELIAYNRSGEVVPIQFYKEVLVSIRENIYFIGYALIWCYLFIKAKKKHANRN